MRVYISGAITGVKDWKDHFKKSEESLLALNHIVFNPARIEEVIPELKYEEYMKIEMFVLSMCDAIYMLKGWENSKGANREYGYALGKGLKIMEEEE